MRNSLISFIGLLLLFTLNFAYATTTPKKWTFLIYLNGDNNLDSFGTKNIISMEKVGSNDQVNIVVQWASLSARKTVRLLVKKSTDPTKVTSPVIEDMGLVDMGDYNSLQEFIRWGVEYFPADHYFVDVWDHGSGWHLQQLKGNLRTNQNTLNDISWDEISGHHITTEQLGQAIAYGAGIIGHKIDIYGSDACLMAMIEVAHEMANSVEDYVGSEEVIPGNGWPYAEFLARWEARPNATADQISKILTEEYVKSYEGGSGGQAEVTFSAFRMNKLAQIDRAFRRVSDDLRTIDPQDKSKVLDVANATQGFMQYDYRDLGDFLKRLKKANLNGIPNKDINYTLDALNDFVIANADTPGYKAATGVSIWWPLTNSQYTEYADRYSKLAFNNATQWGLTLDFLLSPK